MEESQEMKALGGKYTNLCMNLGDCITKIDLMLETKNKIKEEISEVNRQALALKAKEDKERAKKEAAPALEVVKDEPISQASV